MKRIVTICVIFGVMLMLTSSTFALMPCDVGHHTCSRSCIWLGLTWQSKFVGYAPRRLITGSCLVIDAYDVDGTCASEYNMDWTGSCVDYVQEVRYTFP